jgi:hypothetical protein
MLSMRGYGFQEERRRGSYDGVTRTISTRVPASSAVSQNVGVEASIGVRLRSSVHIPREAVVSVGGSISRPTTLLEEELEGLLVADCRSQHRIAVLCQHADGTDEEGHDVWVVDLMSAADTFVDIPHQLP